jgi:uncharacterized DUF497 family protein
LQCTWNEAKNSSNKLKHGLSFEIAQLIFDDPLAMSRRDLYPNEERWQTLGLVNYVIIFVVHTSPEYDSQSGEEVGRIISARKATKHERRTYEEGNF